MKNVLVYTFYLCLLVIGGLLLLSLLPQQWLEKHNLEPIDILSELHPTTDAPLADSTMAVAKAEDIACPDSLTCLEDFSKTHQGMDFFFHSLACRDSLKRPVRIAFFGDSFIEGDIFCAPFRRFMQDEFGGNGVGFMPVTSATPGFRQTIRHSFSGWASNDITTDTNSHKYGINGCCYFPTNDASVKYRGIPKDKHLSTFQQVTVYYKNQNPAYQIQFKADSLPNEYVALDTASVLAAKSMTGNFSTLKMQFSSDRNVCVYGVSLGSTSGVLVDNFSMRGQPGMGLLKIPEATLQAFSEQMPYDLIILQYGLNVMSPKQSNYDIYGNKMIAVVEYLQKCFPNTSILLLSVADRSMLQNGNYVSVPTIHPFIATQKRICEKTGIVFWNLFEAMGGEKSMVGLVKSSPPKANKDYTHINFRGGEYLGQKLFNTLLFEKQRYDAREQAKLAAQKDSLQKAEHIKKK